MSDLIDHKAISQIKELNKVNKIVAFEFFDANGKSATETNRPVVKVVIEFSTGDKFIINNETLEEFGDYEFNIGRDLH